jgi:L-lactate utilization protein LutC
MSGRDRILAKVRKAARDVPMPDRLKPTLAGTSGAAAVQQFIAQAEKVNATTSRIHSMDDLPQALAEELRNRNLPAAIRTGDDPAFDRDWGTVERTTGAGRVAEPATLTRAEMGMAETGSLIFASGPDNPVTLNFLGETHFAVVDAEDIVGGFEELWTKWRAAGRDPRTVNLVTGPSRSGDIGQVLQLGAHGPVALHIFVVGSPENG